MFFKKKKDNSTYRSMRGVQPLLSFTADAWNQTVSSLGVQVKEKKEDTRVPFRPIDVWESLISEPPNLDCTKLDKKISIIKHRIKVLGENTREHLTDEYEVLAYLEARKKYQKYIKDFEWPVTTQILIDALCLKYQVKVVPLDQFYTLLPEEGIEELSEYRNLCNKIRKDKPEIRLIIPDKKEEKIEKRKRDPILLASSPFGRWDFILVAWDKEVAIVDD